MSLLKLQDIGKIYVSEGNVAVGIRGVNLSFDRGEFVAITGKSGSGKSTLLNVISGMDTYEEGELYIDGETTSHYLQPEWEEYRRRYISFIFQDYNIIDSFTVLQNVELALMHIENPKERRARALSLLSRVGLSSHIHHKGSRLSGGQKQRTVIARALAKDSPIILADEPTGNLDSATSEEIINLLREISRDKLLIMVTHNFDQVAYCATRHIRIFDGAVESDQALAPAEPIFTDPMEELAPSAPVPAKQGSSKNFKHGLTLGRSIFTSRPKLSIFLCLLLIIGALGIFLITGYCGDASLLFEDYTMFTPTEGRVVLTNRDGTPPTNDELSALSTELGAKDFLRYDSLLDGHNYTYVSNDELFRHLTFNAVIGKTYDDVKILGRYPEAAEEVLLYVPISYQPLFGKDALLIDTLTLNGHLDVTVAGVAYYYDNRQDPEVLFTKDGLLTASAITSILQFCDINMNIAAMTEESSFSFGEYKFGICDELAPDRVYVNLSHYKDQDLQDAELSIRLSIRSYGNGPYGGSFSSSDSFQKTINTENIITELPAGAIAEENYIVYVSTGFIRSLYEEMNATRYRQASLFFADDEAASAALASLKDKGYVAVLSSTEYEPSWDETLSSTLLGVMMAVLWLIAILFIAFFLNLCSLRTLDAFKSDMAIMRSMGIPVKVIRTGMYVRMLIALIPAYAAVIAAGFLVFRSPILNEFFRYLSPVQYALIFAGLLLLTWRMTRKQIRRLFGESVKKSLKGGEEA